MSLELLQVRGVDHRAGVCRVQAVLVQHVQSQTLVVVILAVLNDRRQVIAPLRLLVVDPATDLVLRQVVPIESQRALDEEVPEILWVYIRALSVDQARVLLQILEYRVHVLGIVGRVVSS